MLLIVVVGLGLVIFKEMTFVKIDHVQILLPRNAALRVWAARISNLVDILQILARLSPVSQETLQDQVIVRRFADFEQSDPRAFSQRILNRVSILNFAYFACEGLPRVSDNLFVTGYTNDISPRKPRLNAIQVHYALGANTIARTYQRIILRLCICEAKAAGYCRLTLRFLRRFLFCDL